jgi:uncharacterized membrane protein YfcA
MKNKPQLNEKLVYDEFLEIQNIRNRSLKYQSFLMSSILGLIGILVVSYISGVLYIQILLLYLSVVIIYLLFQNHKNMKDNTTYYKLLKNIRERFKNN